MRDSQRIQLLQRSSGEDRRRNYHPLAAAVFHHVLKLMRLHNYHTHIDSKYRTFRVLGPLRNEVYTTKPANVEYILKTNFQNYGKGWFHYKRLNDLFGDGIFVVDGEMWKQQRKLVSCDFSTKVLRDFSSVVFRSNAAKLVLLVAQAAVTNPGIRSSSIVVKIVMCQERLCLERVVKIAELCLLISESIEESF